MSGLTKRGLPRKRNYPQGRNPRNAPVYDRILRYVEEDENGCWLWTASLVAGSGYGSIQIGYTRRNAHRVAYEAFIGDVPEGLHLDHLCRVRRCVNPWHLEPVTPLINTQRGVGNHGKETHCPQGHEYTEANTYRRTGRRYCLTCRHAYRHLYNSMTPEERAARKAAGLPVVDLAAYFNNQTLERAA